MVAAFLVALPILMNVYHGHTGKFIVASDLLVGDKNFTNSVIYIYNHSIWGARGIVLNQPVNEDDLGVFKGGPIHYPKLQSVIIERSKAITRWRTQPLSVRPYSGDYAAYRSYQGIASWGFWQLETEIKGDYWVVLECNASAVLQLDHLDMRGVLFGRQGSEICKNKKLNH